MKYINGNAYWVKVNGESWLAYYLNEDFWITEDRFIEENNEDVEEIIHIKFPDGWKKEVY